MSFVEPSAGCKEPSASCKKPSAGNKLNKTELLEAFEHYLDTQADDTHSDKFNATFDHYEPQIDLYSLFVEMSTLKNEVKTQARQFKTAMDDFREVFQSMKEQQHYLEQELKQKEKQKQLIKQKVSRAFLLDMIALRDRILLSIESINDYQASRMEALLGGKQSLKNTVLEGQQFILKRIDRQLKQHQVRLINTNAQSLNPRLMKVVALDNRPELKNGMIIEEIRAGFIWNKQLLRPAEVKVNKLEQNT